MLIKTKDFNKINDEPDLFNKRKIIYSKNVTNPISYMLF